VEVTTAYAACEVITRHEARNFAYGIRLLAPPERRALSAVYALARRIDDIGDGDGPAEAKAAALDAVRRALADLSPGSTDPVLAAVADAVHRYPIPVGAFEELIDGCQMDVVGTSYETVDDLVVYCRLVAGSIGRLSLGIFGCVDRAAAAPLADALGVALQLTNILRDVVEDRRMGRAYLPAKDAAAVGCLPDLSGPPAALAALVALEAGLAEEWYQTGLGLLALLDRRSAACVGTMAGIYHRLLHRIGADPSAVTRGRVSLPTTEKLAVAAGCLLRAAR